MQKIIRFHFPLICSLLLLLGAGCSTIATYDQSAYAQAVNAKVDSLALMSKATGSYSGHASEVAALNLELEKAYEYEVGRPLNGDTVAEWQKILNPDGDLLGGFLRDWKADGPVLPAQITQKKKQIGKAFDTIIQTESGKIKN
jgi:outer membrane murein-binding lipoprotein Lpp